MTGFADRMVAVGDELTAAGIRVFLDVSEINPPGVFIQPPELRFRFRKGDADLDMSLIAIVVNNEPRKALQQCSELVDAVQAVLGERAATGQPAEVFMQEQAGSIRAYQLNYTDTFRNPRGSAR